MSYRLALIILCTYVMTCHTKLCHLIPYLMISHHVMSYCSPVAGNETGITTFQLDIKSEGLTLETLERALLQVRTVCGVWVYVRLCACVCGVERVCMSRSRWSRKCFSMNFRVWEFVRVYCVHWQYAIIILKPRKSDWNLLIIEFTVHRPFIFYFYCFLS